MKYPWVTFEDGNYTNLLNDTKIRETEDDFLNPTAIESIDTKLTNCCSMERFDLKDTVDGMYMHLRNKDLYEDLHAEQIEQM